MKNTFIGFGFLALLCASTACSFVARDSEMYSNDTAKLLESKSGDIKVCYDAVLKGDAKVAGTVAVAFKVEKKTGKIVEAQIDATKTNAPDSLRKCVTDVLSTLALDPPDRRDGVASFTWEFSSSVGGAPAPEAAPPAPPPAG